MMVQLRKSIYDGLVRSCHDCSEGGLAIAAAEMAFAGGLGLNVDLSRVPYKGRKRDDYILFAESNTRFLVEVPEGRYREFERKMEGYPVSRIGEVTPYSNLEISGLRGGQVVNESLTALKESWQRTLRW